MSPGRPHKTVDVNALPTHYDSAQIEKSWADRWSAWNLHAYDPSRPRAETFVVDTPPPTVSGALHMGHIFSYTHQDLIVRQQRMLGRNIFYPMGWDDNGLPSERRAERHFHIRCVATLPYEPNLEVPPANAKIRESAPRQLSRKNFVEHCDRLVEEDERGFQELWTRAGLSVDWNQTYRTNDAHSRRLAQWSFLDLKKKGHVYHTSAPTMWDVDFQTAVAQAEVEERPVPSAYHPIVFRVEGSDQSFTIATTRPELLPACVGVTAHPDDPRYKPLFGKMALTPLFHAPVKIFPSEKVNPEQGSGIVMVCTFGDATDVQWWREQNLPLRQVLGKDGRFLPIDFAAEPFVSRNVEAANLAYTALRGQRVNRAREAIVAALSAPGSSGIGDAPALADKPKDIVHPVKFYEKGDKPLEFMIAPQWFVSLLKHKEALIERGASLTWHPAFMHERFELWTKNLQYDWCVSRQRYFGVSLPVWYPLDENGEPRADAAITAPEASLPIDPMLDTPPGYQEEQRGKPGGFAADPDVFDTWFTSSITPQIASGWHDNPERHAGLFPADIRPQGHEIIRTWAFYTIAKAHLHDAQVPWHNVLVSGWILDPERKKMSKSKGNVVVPGALLEAHSADAVRYWAARARLGTDAIFDESVFKVGKRLTTKLYNAAKLVMAFPGNEGPITEQLDLSFIARLRTVVQSATEDFATFDFSGALRATEDFFWKDFTDTYAELVKPRARGELGEAARDSAVTTLRLALSVVLRLFAPIVPYVAEEIWSWQFAEETGVKSVHIAQWPRVEEFAQIAEPSADALSAASELYGALNRAKTELSLSRRALLRVVEVETTPELEAAARAAMLDVAPSLRIERCDFKLAGSAPAHPIAARIVEYFEEKQATPNA